MKNIASIVSGNQAAIDKAFAEGLHVAGERFVLTKNDEGSVYARKVRQDNKWPLARGGGKWMCSRVDKLINL